MPKIAWIAVLFCGLFLVAQPARADSVTFNDLTHTLSNTSFLETAFTVNWSDGITDTIQVCSSAGGSMTPCGTAGLSITGSGPDTAVSCPTILLGYETCRATFLAPTGGATVTSAMAGNGSIVNLGSDPELFISGLGNEAGILNDEATISFSAGLNSYTVDFTSSDDSPTPVPCYGACTTPPVHVPEPSSLLQLGAGLLAVGALFYGKLRP